MPASHAFSRLLLPSSRVFSRLLMTSPALSMAPCNITPPLRRYISLLMVASLRHVWRVMMSGGSGLGYLASSW